MVFVSSTFTEFLKRTRAHFAGPLDHSHVRAIDTVIESDTKVQERPDHRLEHTEGLAGNKGEESVRRGADPRLFRARSGFPGSYRAYTDDGHKVIFNMWVSADGTVRILHPKVCWKDGVEIARWRGKGPHLPMRVLFGRTADVSRFPKKEREALELFYTVLLTAVLEYDVRWHEQQLLQKVQARVEQMASL